LSDVLEITLDDTLYFKQQQTYIKLRYIKQFETSPKTKQNLKDAQC